ncbi:MULTISPECIES: purine-cytosine permease family protein [Streptomycetaceae]|uniref:Permease for cytosine/purines, uracil, thiamine, allantoin n=1 Tax=Streptantibioticus cattleyicolor (strain ATCC 35852 / DSM 46488 / JCM 4925 / NBRC 14057 / NRRL 8057) TaxID=1003195 RepID=F8JZR9_STREN|nr:MULTISPECIES: cytosine permease [Streptomycetaceae]AEW94446.1 permease for cytosine/purines, uracil, thiamine, allantoin [Streptantibioticus cattleyicolor NRRL 8057 = DSM 46488]MYS59093.1 cytosine permease [Streptomyces sp. SID5468]CCB74803.1 Permease for cytosine/purines, uracil, thiamine, allantoin [Streptantibioticus cattleyicolor NRRL 8057 = DSM 46488]
MERRSIEVVPDGERHGRPFSQFTLWLSANLQITAVVTGALAVVFGAAAPWAVAGLLIGNLLGGAVMALHAAQGPRLGLPQMISSRAQFGVRGAIVPLLLVVVMYVGFFAAGTVLAGQAVGHLTGLGDTPGIVLFALVTAAAAVAGYRVVHLLGRIAGLIGAVAFVFLGARLLERADLSALWHHHAFSLPLFLLAVSLSASWQLAFGPYVADYSRYLPRDTSGRSVFWWTLGGTTLGSQWSMTFGALAAATAGPAFTGHEVPYVVGLGGGGALMTGVLYLVIALGKLTINVLNTYGGFMSLATGVSALRRRRELSAGTRVAYIAGVMVAGTVVALLGKDSFLSSFKDFLLFLLAFFTPWSAINLADFYWVSKERYDLGALFDPAGRYGSWRWRTIAVYVVGVAAQLPFISSSFYTGPLVAPLGGADVSWLVGLVLTAALYVVCGAGRASGRSGAEPAGPRGARGEPGRDVNARV